MPEITTTYKDHIWNYLSYTLNLGINIFLLPVILYYLSESELGLWYVMTSIGAMATLVDFGFAPQMARQISYCYSGATEIRAEGLSGIQKEAESSELFYSLIATSRSLYAIIAIILFIVLVTVGTSYIKHVSKSIYNNYVLFAWVLYALSCVVNIYYAYYNSFFRGIGKFITLSKATVISKGIQLIISLSGLYYGYGIFAVALGYFLGILTFRVCLHRAFLHLSPAPIKLSITKRIETFKLLWHNAWREGVVTFSRYISTQVNTILCSSYLGLVETAQYSLCIQILNIISNFSSIYYSTVQPTLSAAMLKHRLPDIQSIIAKSWSIYIFLFLIMVAGVLFAGEKILMVVHSKTQLNTLLFSAIAVYMFLEGNQSLCASFISTTNKLLYVWPFLCFSLLSLLGSLLLLHFTNIGVWALVISPIICQALYNNWKWPSYIMTISKLSIGKILKILKQEYLIFCNIFYNKLKRIS